MYTINCTEKMNVNFCILPTKHAWYTEDSVGFIESFDTLTEAIVKYYSYYGKFKEVVKS